MRDLKVTEYSNERELIHVTYDNDRITVSARELHEFLDVSTRYNDWFKRMCEYGFDKNVDYQAITQKRVTAQGNETTYVDHQLTIEMAKEISMIQRNEKGKQARQYFIQCEKQLEKNAVALSGLSAELRLLIKIELEQNKQQKQIDSVKNELQEIRDVVAVNSDNWRKDANKLVNKIVSASDGELTQQDVYNQIYDLLDRRLGVKVRKRLTNMKKRMRAEGTSTSKISYLNCLDVIACDKKLIEGYISMVKEVAIKYGVA